MQVRTIALCTMVFMASAQAADGFAPPGAKATLAVEYRYASTGQAGPSRDKSLVLQEWRSKRLVEMSAELVASKPLPFPSLRVADAATTARVQQQGAQMQKPSAQMVPMSAACRCVPSAAGPPTGACVRVRQAALGRRDQDSGCLFRVEACRRVWAGD